MTNTSSEDVDLGLALDSSNYRIRTRLNNSPGAGVNANSRGDMGFASPDPLSELVWSPHNGLRLKCANSNMADKKPFLMWNVGPSGNVLSPSQYITSKEIEDDNAVDALFGENATSVGPSTSRQPELSASRGNCDWKGDSIMEEEVGTRDALQEEGNLCSQENLQIADIAENGKKNVGLETSADGISGCKVDMTTNLQSQKEPDCELTSAVVEVNKNKIDMPFSIPANETTSSREMKVLKENSHSVEGSPMSSRICLYQKKGKERVLSDVDINVRSSSDDKDNSHESVESCNNSAGSFSTGVKRQSCDQGLVPESKRMKKDDSSFIVRHDSSFMNWISNMVKGLSDSTKQDSPSPHLALTLACSNDVYSKKTHDSASLSMGFQTIFQSLSCRNTIISNNEAHKEENDSKGESQEVMVADKTSFGSLPQLCESNKNNSCGLSNKEANPITVGQTSKPWIFSAYIDCSPHVDMSENKAPDNLVRDVAEKGLIPSDSSGEKTNTTAEKTTPEKSNPLTSLWITRLSTRTPRSEKSDEITRETNEGSTFFPKVNLARAVDGVCPIGRKRPVLGNPFPSYQTWNVKKYCSSKSVSTSNEIRRSTPSSLANNVEDNRKSQNNTCVSSKVFDAIRNLRLSRADILRWMNSGVSLSHLSGFFLRLRLGKVEAGLEGSSYYVACITGDGRSKKSVSVDVGGIRSSVGTQFVSNNDFLEDEIEAWWCRIMDSGCKIPSLDELNSKLKDRQILGF